MLAHVIVATGGLFGGVVLSALVFFFLHLGSDVGDEIANGPLARVLAMFGIGDLPVELARAAFLAGAGAAGLALSVLAHLRLGGNCPAWFPAIALSTLR